MNKADVVADAAVKNGEKKKRRSKKKSGNSDILEADSIPPDAVDPDPAEGPTSPPTEWQSIEEEATDIVGLFVDDFFDSAWKICAERFTVEEAPTTVMWELRNTWLRVVEAECQEPPIFGIPTYGPNKVFQHDDAPLPLALDTWSCGGLELMPSNRRESVMDPFLRDQIPDLSFGKKSMEPVVGESNLSEDLEGVPEKMAQDESEEKQNTDENVLDTVDDMLQERIVKGREKSFTDLISDAPEGEKWNFEMDKELASTIVPESSCPSPESEPTVTVDSTEDESSPLEQSDSAEDIYTQGAEAKRTSNLEPQVEAIVPPRNVQSRSSTEIDFVSRNRVSGEGRTSLENPITADGGTKDVPNYDKARGPGGAGAGVGSGVFTLPAYRSYHSKIFTPASLEVLHEEDKRENWLLEEWKQNLGDTPNDPNEETDAEVRPLFMEAYKAERHRVTRIFKEVKDVFELEEGTKLQPVFSEVPESFLRRQVLNLQNRFNKQLWRNLKNMKKPKKSESNHSIPSSPAFGSKNGSSESVNNSEEEKRRSRGQSLENDRLRNSKQGSPFGRIFGNQKPDRAKKPSLPKQERERFNIGMRPSEIFMELRHLGNGKHSDSCKDLLQPTFCRDDPIDRGQRCADKPQCR